MIVLENELNKFGRFSSGDIRAWGKKNLAHTVVMDLIRKGAYFSKLSFPREACPKGIPRSKVLKDAIAALAVLMNSSYEPKRNLCESEIKDVFLNGIAAKSIHSVFLKKGWSSRVWPASLVEYSSFRAAIGMAMVIYAIYIRDSMARKDYELAMTQCADALGLVVMDGEKKLSIKNRANKEKIDKMPALILSEQGKKAVSNRLDQQLKAGWIEHCKNARLEGIEISRLDDLLQLEGYDPRTTKISERNLKKWAKEVGVTFKAGRPKK